MYHRKVNYKLAKNVAGSLRGPNNHFLSPSSEPNERDTRLQQTVTQNTTY